MKLRFALPVAIGAVILLAGCGSTSTSGASTSPSAGTSPASSPSFTGGFGDTSKYPDRPAFICAEQGDQIYFTVAGPDTAKGKAYCSNQENTGFQPLGGTVLPAGSYEPLTASNGCWLVPNYGYAGVDIVRVYTPNPSQFGPARALQICHAFGVT